MSGLNGLIQNAMYTNTPTTMARMQGSPQIHNMEPPKPGGTPAPGGKPGGPPMTGKMGGPPQQYVGPSQNIFGQAGSYHPMMQPPQPGFPPPTGKPGMPPVNPQALHGMRPQIGPSILPQNSASLAEAAAGSQVPIPPVGGGQYTIGARSGGHNVANPFRRPV